MNPLLKRVSKHQLQFSADGRWLPSRRSLERRRARLDHVARVAEQSRYELAHFIKTRHRPALKLRRRWVQEIAFPASAL